MKSYTDLEQSKKLAEILPLESADMYWKNGVSDKYIQCFTPFTGDGADYDYDVPCWSLAALLNVLPNNENISTTISKGGYRISTFEYTNSWFVEYEDETNGLNNCVTSASNPIDVCYEMIIKLYKQNLL